MPARVGAQVRAANDVYSLAASLHYWITGFVFREDVRFPSITALRPDLLELNGLDELLRQCLQEDDRLRPSASDVMASLGSALPRS